MKALREAGLISGSQDSDGPGSATCWQCNLRELCILSGPASSFEMGTIATVQGPVRSPCNVRKFSLASSQSLMSARRTQW